MLLYSSLFKLSLLIAIEEAYLIYDVYNENAKSHCLCWFRV